MRQYSVKKRVFDFTALPEPFDQMDQPDLILDLHERIAYLTDLIETALGLEYLKAARRD